MEFRDEIAATGELSEVGLPLRRNVDHSYRRGIELEAHWRIAPAWQSSTVMALSRNRIEEWTQFYDVYDADFNWTGTRPVVHRDVEPLMSPSVLLTQSVTWTPDPQFSAGVLARYNGRAYLDNTGEEAFSVDPQVLVDASLSWSLSSLIRLSLTVENLFDVDDAWASGYSYRYFVESERTGTAYFFPRAPRSATLLFDFTL
jgi:iron complex outermembrane receptor protein